MTNFQIMLTLSILTERLVFENTVPGEESAPVQHTSQNDTGSNTIRFGEKAPTMTTDQFTGEKRQVSLMDLFPVNGGKGKF